MLSDKYMKILFSSLSTPGSSRVWALGAAVSSVAVTEGPGGRGHPSPGRVPGE